MDSERQCIRIEATPRELAAWLAGILITVVIPTILIVGGLWLVLAT